MEVQPSGGQFQDTWIQAGIVGITAGDFCIGLFLRPASRHEQASPSGGRLFTISNCRLLTKLSSCFGFVKFLSSEKGAWPFHLIEFKYANRSAMAGRSICFSSPSGMNDNPVLRNSSM